MTDDVWSGLHKIYETKDWIDKPSLFAEDAISYFPPNGTVLDLGAGQGQDSRFFAEHGYTVISTDIEDLALEKSRAKLPANLASSMTLQKVDLREALPFEDNYFDAVYAHLSLHYFDASTTARLFDQIHRVLKPGGILAFFTNSIDDPEYNTGTKLEDDFFQIEGASKRYFSTETALQFANKFTPILVDNNGETYKDSEKGIHNLIRFIGTRA